MEEMEVKTNELEPVVDEVETAVEETTGSGSRSGIGLGMLIGSGLTLAAIVGGKKLKEMWAERRARKEQPEAVDAEIVESSEENETGISEYEETGED